MILGIDGTPVTARRPEDSDVLARQIRQYRAGTSATFSLWRDGTKLEVPVILEVQPVPAAEMPWWEDQQLEYAVREPAFDDRIRLQLAPDAVGVLVESVVPAGWAALAGLRPDDLVLEAEGKRVTAVADFHKARDEAAQGKAAWWVLLIERRGQTMYVEINLKPLKS